MASSLNNATMKAMRKVSDHSVEAHAGPAGTGARESGDHCANCGAVVHDAYCSHCGQETRLKLPTLREFMREAAGRLVALDSRFWRTVGVLIRRPGFLTREYLAGRRRRYIRPARLYLFSTLMFFAISRLFVEPGDIVTIDTKAGASEPGVTLSVGPEAARKAAAKSDRVAKAVEAAAKVDAKPKADAEDDFSTMIGDKDLADSLPPAVGRRWDHFKALPRERKAEQMADGMMRYAPYALFVLLPIFAALLQLVYAGSGRRRPLRPRLYGEHLVFAAHNHALFFVVATAMLLAPWAAVRIALGMWIALYLWWSLRVVYGGTRTGAIIRSLILLIGYAALIGVAVIGLVLVSTLIH